MVWQQQPQQQQKHNTIPTKRPICIEGNIESMSVNGNEAYKFDYNRNPGVILEFLK
jgi:hypothetical protein